MISTYTQIVSFTTPKTILLAYGFLCHLPIFMVFTGGCTIFIYATETKMLAKQVQINKVIGSLLCVLGVILLFTKFQ